MKITNPGLLAILAELCRSTRDRKEDVHPTIISATLSRRRGRNGSASTSHVATVLTSAIYADGRGPYFRVSRCRKVEGEWRHEVSISSLAEIEAMADLCDDAIAQIEALAPEPPRLRIAPPVRETPPDDDGKPLVHGFQEMPPRRWVGGRRDA